jgi:ribosomal-protein-alanine N-acetyltransferase
MKNSGVIIRNSTMFDVPKIKIIEDEAFPTPWSFNALFSDIAVNKNTKYFSAVVGGVVVGYGGMWHVLDECHITNVAVEKDFRRQGIAGRLMLALVSAARDMNAKIMTLEVRRSNTGAQKLYAGLDFIEIGVRRDYYSNPAEDALILCKTL